MLHLCLHGLHQNSRWIFRWSVITLFVLIAVLSPGNILPLAASGAYTLGSVGDLVWNDLNSDGLYESGEPGVPNVELTLYKADNTFVTTAITDANGHYRLTTLPQIGDQYYVQVDPKTLLDMGYAINTQNLGGLQSNTEIDSDFDQIKGKTPLLPIQQWINDNSHDLGLVQIPECQVPYDIVLTLDESPLVSGSKNRFEYMLNFARIFTRGFEIARPLTHISVVQFSRTNFYGGNFSRVEIGLREHFNRPDLIGDIDTIIESGGKSTNIWEGLRLARQQFQTQGRRGVQQVIILVTDGEHNEDFFFGNPLSMANQLKGEGRIIFVVKLANPNPLSLTYATGIASSPVSKFLYQKAQTQTDLISVMSDLLQNVCSLPTSANGSPLRNYYTTHNPDLSWNPVSWAIKYQVEISDTERFELPVIQTATLPLNDLNFTPSSLENGVYYWRVRAAETETKWGSWSSPEMFEVYVP